MYHTINFLEKFKQIYQDQAFKTQTPFHIDIKKEKLKKTNIKESYRLFLSY